VFNDKNNGISGGSSTSSTPQTQLLFPRLVQSISRKWLFSGYNKESVVLVVC